MAPAWPADSSSTGMPPSTATRRHSSDSSANFIGGTTKQLDWLTNGRARHCSSPPAMTCSISRVFSTWRASLQLAPTCLDVPITAL